MQRNFVFPCSSFFFCTQILWWKKKSRFALIHVFRACHQMASLLEDSATALTGLAISAGEDDKKKHMQHTQHVTSMYWYILTMIHIPRHRTRNQQLDPVREIGIPRYRSLARSSRAQHRVRLICCWTRYGCSTFEQEHKKPPPAPTQAHKIYDDSYTYDSILLREFLATAIKLICGVHHFRPPSTQSLKGCKHGTNRFGKKLLNSRYLVYRRININININNTAVQ